MEVDKQKVVDSLIQQFEGNVGNIEETYGLTTLQVRKSSIFEVIKYLKEEQSFTLLTDVCGMHFPDNDPEMQFAVVYHIHNLFKNIRLRLRVFLPADNPEVDSMVDVFSSANWQERETYDFFGIIFKNHPNLVRILNMDEMEVFPLRKEFPLEDGGRIDKDDRFFGRSIHNE
ncbi:MAG TPA: NADH-quinone oxidoreductase subunit C [Chitinophagales bacterium]|nr:NADH-quinone oxidoreductase subunit C [Chitinophagales bacterium]